jgi:3-hydroxyisobutyrate dehydrogenase-like beta-hydroxyacid dehydrogenase
MKQRTGVIGLGLLGSAIAERLVAAEHQVCGFDLRDEALLHATHCGVRRTSSLDEVVADSDCVILCLPDSQVVAQVTQQVGAQVHGKFFIDATTGHPDDASQTGRLLAEHGARYVEANVVGSSAVVRAGESVVLLGGDPRDCGEAALLVSAFSNRSSYVGPLGSASRAKLVVNLVLGLNRAVLAEGLNLARCCGLDPASMLDILRSGAAYSRVMDAKGRKMIEEDFTPEARLAQHHKDVRLILDMAQQSGAPVPLTREHDRLLSRAASLGLADLDNSAIIRAFAAHDDS